MGEYNFGDWLQSQIGKDFTELLKNGEEDAAEAEVGSVGVKGAVQKRESGSLEFAQRVKQFLFFLRYGEKPDSVSDIDWQSYRPIIEALVKKRQMNDEVMDLFAQKPPRPHLP